MMPGETVPGQNQAWNLVRKLGEGDAGEVYLVESLLERRTAILKRPHRTSFTTDAIRQATQIEREGQILSSLAGLGLTSLGRNVQAGYVYAPALLDRSKAGTEYSERYFIVISKASGFDLNSLARTVHFGASYPADNTAAQLSEAEHLVFKRLSEGSLVPDLILLRAISGMLHFFERIHGAQTNGSLSGILWNDVKPEHIFWDPLQRCFTLIDWGNAQQLEADGATKDRRYSRLQDYRQFVQEIGRFLADAAPVLYGRLKWPNDISPTGLYSETIQALNEKTGELLAEKEEALRLLRQEEQELLAGPPGEPQFKRLAIVQSQIIQNGELPDFDGARRFYLVLAQDLAAIHELGEFRSLCEHAAQSPIFEAVKWRLLGRISELPVVEAGSYHILVAGLSDDWPAVLWDLRRAALSDPEPLWWDEAAGEVRQLELKNGSEHRTALPLTPLVALHRLAHALQALAMQDSFPRPASTPVDSEANATNNHNDICAQLSKTLREGPLARWRELEPDPPNSGLDYLEIETLLDEIQECLPESVIALERALNQPRAQVKIILSAWENQEFETARRGLRRLLLWDPDRRRILTTDRAIQRAPIWLAELRQGPPESQDLLEFITRLEYSGRELRNQVGAAPWLDLFLNALAALRKGRQPFDLLLESPELRSELAWLRAYEHELSENILSGTPGPTSLERLPETAETLAPTLQGRQESSLGEGRPIWLNDPLDTWASEARGSSARVFQGSLRSADGHLYQTAIKIMRPDRLEYALPLFREEVLVLHAMQDVPGVNRLYECGFIHLDADQTLPAEDRHISAGELSGMALRFGPDTRTSFLRELEGRASQGWLPYLALEKRERAENLLLSCDTSYTAGRLLPLMDGLRIAIQSCEILSAAHARNIVYRDHKILHYYWHAASNGVMLIDWNVARLHPNGLAPGDIQFDLVQFAARALHYMLTGRPAPGALPLGPNRPEEIEAAARSYGAQWTYDDQRLPQSLKEILERALASEYKDAQHLKEDLLLLFQQLSEVLEERETP